MQIKKPPCSETGDKTEKTGSKNERKTTDDDSSTSSDDEYFIQALRTGSRPRKLDDNKIKLRQRESRYLMYMFIYVYIGARQCGGR